MTEEAIVRMGLDTDPLARGLRKAQGMMHSAGETMKEEFSHVGAHITAALSLAGVIATMERAMTKAQSITRQAENLGVSTDFIQDIKNVAMASGIAEDKVEGLLNKFIKGLPAGTDVEEEFYRVADSIAAIEDPATRARIATDKFGKSGVQLIAVLSKGKDGIKEFADQFSKFSKEDIKQLEEAKMEMEKFENFFTVWAGRLMIGAEFLFKGLLTIGGGIPGLLDLIGKSPFGDFMGMFKKKTEAPKGGGDSLDPALLKKYMEALREIQLKSSQVSYEQKHSILDQMYLEEVAAFKAAKSENERVAIMLKMAKLKEEIVELEAKHSKELDEKLNKEEEARKREEKHRQTLQERVDREKRNLNMAQKSPYEFTLEELAQSGRWLNNSSGSIWTGGAGGAQAQQVLQLREWAKWNFMHGNMGLGEQQRSRADELFNSLTSRNPYLRNPYEKMIDELQKANEKLAGTLIVAGEDE